MKKSLIALAVAGALTAPMVAQADATLYGSLRIKAVATDNTDLDVQDNSSRIGVKGSTDLFSGAKAFFQFEQAVSTETGAFGSGRLANLGLTGDFGTAVFGRIWTPYYNWTGAPTDVADNSTSASSVYQIGAHRASNVIAYVTPNMQGFQAAVAVLANENDAAGFDDSEEIDAAHVAATYTLGGLNVGVSYLGFDGNATSAAAGNDTDVISAAASYTLDNLYVATRLENRDTDGAAEQDAWELAGVYTLGNTKLIANYIDDEKFADEKWSLEVQQKLGKQARVFAAYIDEGSNDGIEAGYRVDF